MASARQLRNGQLLDGAVACAKTAIIASEHGNLQVEGAVGAFDKLAACCRSLGLSAKCGAQEFSHVARLERCVLELLSRLVPVRAPPQQQSPRAQDVALVQGLLQSKLLVALAHALQRLMPEHTAAQVNDSGECSCCVPSATAWNRLVPFEPRASNSQAAGASSSTAAATAAAAGRDATSSSRSSSSAATQQASCRVTVAAAVNTLLLRLLKLVVALCTWLESVGQWVEGHSAAGHERLCAQLRQLQLDAMEHLLRSALADVRGTRLMLAPFPLLELYCSGSMGFFTADKGVRTPTGDDDLPRLQAVLPKTASRAQHYTQLVALMGSQLCCLLRPLSPHDRKRWSEVAHYARAWTCSLSCAAQDLSTAQLAAAVPGMHLPDPQQVLARMLRAALWAWRWGTPGSQAKLEAMLVQQLSSIAFKVLDSMEQQQQSSNAAVGQGQGQGESRASEQQPLSPAAVAALDFLGLLASDTAAMQALCTLINKRHLTFLCKVAGGEGLWAAAGADRAHAPRCSVSAALVALGYGALALMRPRTSAHFLQGTRHAATRSHRVIQRLSKALLAAEQQQGSMSAGAAWAGSVLSQVASPPDVAAALAACLTAVWVFVGPEGRGLRLGLPIPADVRKSFLDMFALSGHIMHALAVWLAVEATGSSWGQTHELWRVALQEYGVCNAASKVTSALLDAICSSAPDKTAHTIATLCLSELQPVSVLALGAKITRRMAARQLSQRQQAPTQQQPQQQQPQQQLPFLQRRLAASVDAAVGALKVVWRDAAVVLSPLPPVHAPHVAQEIADALLVHGSFLSFAPHTPQHQAAVNLLRVMCPENACTAAADLCSACDLAPGMAAHKIRAVALVLLVSELVPVRLAQWAAAVTGEPVPVEQLVSQLQDTLLAQGEDAAALGIVARVRAQLQHPAAMSAAECQAMYMAAAAAAGGLPFTWTASLQGLGAWSAAVRAEFAAVLHAWGTAGGSVGSPPVQHHLSAYCNVVWEAKED